MLELEDLRPETPSVGRVISTREAVLISLVLHLSLVIIYLLLPASVWGPDQATVVPSPSGDVVRFVQMDTPKSKIPPKRPTTPSDVDRRAASPIIPPKPENPEPVLKGNTDDHTLASPNEKPKGPETPDPNAGAPSKATPQPSAIDQRAAAEQSPGGGMLGQALRNFDRYTQGSTFNNPNGGQDNAQAQIQFDSMGVDFGPWLDRWVTMVKHNWLVPQAAMTMAGHVVIRLNIHKNGTMTDIEILEPSKVSSFNISAVQALRTSNPGIPLPTAYPVDPMVMTVIFYYNERVK